MSVQPNNSDRYCTASDVARYFRTLEDSNGFDSGTNPTKTEVNAFIDEATDRVDRETGHAWRERTVENEYHDLRGNYYYWAGRPIQLMKREIRYPMDNANKGDKLELYNGDKWEEWVSDSTKDEGRDGDFWLNATDGVLHIYRRGWWNRYKAIRVTYRYGASTIPNDIQQATALYTAATLIETDVYGDLLPTGADAPSPDVVAERLEERAEKILGRRREVRRIGSP